MIPTSQVDDVPIAAPSGPARKRFGATLAGLALAVGGAVAGWLGGPWSLAGAAAIASGTALVLSARRADVTSITHTAAASSAAEPPVALDDAGTGAMVRQVVPVWARQMEATRHTTDTGLARLLESFSAIAGTVDIFTGTLDGSGTAASSGAIDHAIEASAPELDALRAASLRAFEQRNAAVTELGHCSDALAQLTTLSRQAREIARHTRLVAFNASIEANRQAAADKGNQAVAQEMRTLADRMGQTGEAIERIVLGLADRLDQTRRRAEVQDTTPEELRFEIDLRARDALGALLGAIGTTLRGTSQLREAGQTLRTQMDEAFVQFQFGDRVSQMLSIIGNDMNNFVKWTGMHPHAAPHDVAEWLERLEASYTMEEQRSEHHGNVHIDRGSEVEFF